MGKITQKGLRLFIIMLVQLVFDFRCNQQCWRGWGDPERNSGKSGTKLLGWITLYCCKDQSKISKNKNYNLFYSLDHLKNSHNFSEYN